MKKKVTVIAIVAICIIGVGVYHLQTGKQSSEKISSADIAKENKVSVDGDYVTYDYKELKENASAIVKVEVLDELSSSNSLVDYNASFATPVRFCAARSVKVSEVYKSGIGLHAGDVISVQEGSAICKENDTYMQLTLDGTPPLEKGETYILFLEDGDTMSSYPAIMAHQNGMVNLDDLDSNQKYYDIAVKAIVEYESDLNTTEKSEVLNADNIEQISPQAASEEHEFNLDTAEKDSTIILGVKKNKSEAIGVSLETNS